jgi:lipopolysaccharide/colanic/teichoic acid biosynthesis glycosyltransferase
MALDRIVAPVEQAIIRLSDEGLLGAPTHAWQRRLKRPLDIFVASTVLLLLSPLFLVVAVAIKLTSPGPVFYRQTRLGQDRRPFQLIKFRSMVDQADTMLPDVIHLNFASGPLFKVRNDPRLTPIGKILRRCFIDEFPQLINVLRGEMSLVGPRPCLAWEAPLLTETRFTVPQGITGGWQVSGQHQLDGEEADRTEQEYVDNWSMVRDVTILLKTATLMFRLRGL